MGKHKHLTLDDRYAIQHGLDGRESFKQIAEKIGKDPSTISKEVQKHYIIEESGGRGRPFSPCIHRKNCARVSKCDYDKCTNLKCPGYCRECHLRCSKYEEEVCPYFAKPPYVCNGCQKRVSCTLRKHLYKATLAQREYEYVLRENRQGVSLTPQEIERIDNIITPLVKKGHSLHHIYVNNSDILMVSERTLYNYFNLGAFTAKSIDLVRKVRYRQRKKKKEFKLDKHCYEGRTYADFEQFIKDNPDTPIVEMDSVEGKKGGKVLLTIYFRNSGFILAFLRDANTARSVTEIINDLYEKLGRETYCELFPVILTDRGSEFSNPTAIEQDSDGNLRSLVFYCDPSCPYEKGGIEVAHEFIRRVLPKGTSFDHLQQKDIELMMDNINSYKRKKLHNRSAYEMFEFYYDRDVLEKLNAHYIEGNDIVLTPKLLK